jgi:hypothetical protein
VLCVREGIYGFQYLLRSGPAVATVAPPNAASAADCPKIIAPKP